MHDLDRTQLETSWETYGYGPGESGLYESEYPEVPFETGPYESEYPGELPGEAGLYESEYPEVLEGGPYESQYPGELPGEYGQYQSEYPEVTFESGPFESEYPGETGPYESEYPEIFEASPYEAEYPSAYEGPYEAGPYESEYPLNEADEMELASELLEVTNEQELDQFFGKFFSKIGRGIKKVGRGIVRVVRSPIGRVLGGALKAIARKALPVVGGVFGGPVGAMAASSAGKMFGLELEGLSEEDRDFEIARQYVRFATVATLGVGRTPPGTPPRVAVQQAIDSAARKYAPGLVGATIRPAAGPQPATSGEVAARRPMYPAPRPPLALPGRWFRRGHNIVIVGAYR